MPAALATHTQAGAESMPMMPCLPCLQNGQGGGVGDKVGVYVEAGVSLAVAILTIFKLRCGMSRGSGSHLLDLGSGFNL